MFSQKSLFRNSMVLGLGIATTSFMANPAIGAMTYNFGNISANLAADAAIGESQLSVVVDSPDGTMDLTATSVLFTFRNIGADASSITDVYFDDGSILALAGLIDADDDDLVSGSFGDPGVDFTQGASPGNLPSHNSISPAFFATAGFTADSDPSVQPNGVNPGETLGVLFTLQASKDLEDVYSELADGTLRIGIHVQGFDTEGSESFVHNPPPPTTIPPVPLPAAAWMGLPMLAGLGYMKRRKMKS